jgi:hypothetical protein
LAQWNLPDDFAQPGDDYNTNDDEMQPLSEVILNTSLEGIYEWPNDYNSIHHLVYSSFELDHTRIFRINMSVSTWNRYSSFTIYLYDEHADALGYNVPPLIVGGDIQGNNLVFDLTDIRPGRIHFFRIADDNLPSMFSSVETGLIVLRYIID